MHLGSAENRHARGTTPTAGSRLVWSDGPDGMLRALKAPALATTDRPADSENAESIRQRVTGARPLTVLLSSDLSANDSDLRFLLGIGRDPRVQLYRTENLKGVQRRRAKN